MSEIEWDAEVQAVAARAEATLAELELTGQWAAALEVYRLAGAEVDALDIPRTDARYRGAYREARRVRAYLYLREANALRALGRPAEALPLGDKELEAAWASGDMITIARATFSQGGTCLANGDRERGLKLLNDAKAMFEHGQGDEFVQGLGWWHIIQAELANSGVLVEPPHVALALADKALELLRPLKNWPGVARAHAARAAAFDRIPDEAAAQQARAAEQMASSLIVDETP